MSITQIIEHYIDTDLSGTDIHQIIGKNPVLYSNLKSANFNQLFPSNSPYQIILLQTTNVNTGHYVAVIVNSTTIEYFDPYGMGSPDSYKQFTKFDQQYGSLLLNLLKSDPKGRPIISNDVDYQTRKNNVSTCGRWSCSRILYRTLNPNQFKALFNGNSGAINNKDFLITLMTLNLLNDVPEFYSHIK